MIVFAAARVVRASPNAEGRFHFDLPPHAFAEKLLADSPFGVNTALEPDAPDLEARLKAMRDAGIKWGRQDFTCIGWRGRSGVVANTDRKAVC